MTNLLKIGIVAFVALVLTGCGGNKILGINMTDQDNINDAFKSASKQFTEEDRIARVVFHARADAGVTKNAGRMSVYFYKKGSDSVKLMSIPLEFNTGKPQITATHAPNWQRMSIENAVPFSSIDHSMIAKYVNEAGAMVLEADDEYEDDLHFSGVDNYTIEYVNGTGVPIHKFTIESKDDENSGSTLHRYFGFDFEVRDGELIAKDL